MKKKANVEVVEVVEAPASTMYIAGKFTHEARELYSTFANKDVTAEKAVESARKASQAAYDKLVQDGMLWTDFVSLGGKNKGVYDGHKSTTTPELWEALKSARMEGRGERAVRLAATPKKALNARDQKDKRANETWLGRAMSADRDAIRKRQEKKDGTAVTEPQPVETGDKVVDEANKVNHRICKKVRDLQTYIEKHAAVKDAEVTKDVLASVLATFAQVTE
tara:strand:+ start:188 stop:853 length:666 start_codon:yes stop_codon:yes gene_type:complete